MGSMMSKLKRNRSRPKTRAKDAVTSGTDRAPQSSTAGIDVPTTTMPPMLALVAGTETQNPPSTPGTPDLTSLVPGRGNPLITAGTRTLSLWEQALEKVRGNGRGNLDGGEERDILLVQKIISEITQKKEECDEKRWFYINQKGEKVFFVEKLLRQLNKYALIGDIALQHHPDIVALAWAGLRLLLQVGTAYTEQMRTVSESLDDVIRILFCCDIYEKLYRGGKFQIAKDLDTSLVNLYTSILEYLCYAREYLQKDTGAQILESFFSELGVLLVDIKKNEMEVKKNAELAEIEACAEERSVQQERIKELKEHLAMIQEPIGRIEGVIDEIYAIVKRERRTQILGWLSDVPFSDHHSFSSNRRQKDTGLWLLKNESFLKWKNSLSSSILWLRGDAGAGKTILASFIIDEFQNQAKCNEHMLAYFYCDYKQTERREPASILRSLVKQFCLKDLGDPGLLPALVLSTYEKREQDGHSSGALSPKESRDLIVNLSEEYLQTTIVVDALDECEQNTRRELFSTLYDIVASTSRVKIFLTSRYDRDAEEVFANFPSHYINAKDNSEDINMYINEQIERRCDPQRQSGAEKLLLSGNVEPDLKRRIILTLQNKANGMFMWAQLQILALCEKHTSRDIIKALDKLPKDLEATYLEILKRIDSQDSASIHIAKIVLRWLLYTQEPCSTAIIIQALAVHPGEKTLDEVSERWKIPRILHICQNLVVHDENLGNFRFAHFSVQEFLLGHIEFCEERGHIDMTNVCLEVLTHHHHHIENSDITDLVSYSIHNWGTHAFLSGAGISKLQTPCLVFLNSLPAYTAWGSKVIEKNDNLRGSDSIVVPPWWTACYYQLCDVAKSLLEDCEDPNLPNLSGLTPLQYAAGEGHEKVVQLLLAKDGVDVNYKDRDDQTPLHFAAMGGHDKVVQLLLSKDGVDLEFSGKTPLHSAAVEGHEKVVRLLLAKDEIDVNSKDDDGWTPLHCAAMRGYEQVVQLLLAKDGVGLNPKDQYDWTPLHSAARYGHEKVVQLLLSKDGVVVNSKHREGQTPLHFAAMGGHGEVVKLLLGKDGVDVNSQDYYAWTPLHFAAVEAHEKVVQLLLDKEGVDVNSKRWDNQTPLYLAASKGYGRIMQLLLAKDEVDVNSEDIHGYTPLHSAAMGGYEKAVQLLLVKDGIDLNSKDKYGCVPLHSAAKGGHGKVVQLLFAKGGVDVNSKDRDGQTALHFAAMGGHEKVVQLLLSKDRIDVNPKDKHERTPVYWATHYGYENISRILKGLVLEASINDQQSPLYFN